MYPKQRRFSVPVIGKGLLPYLAILCGIGFSFWALSPAFAYAKSLPEKSGVSIENSPQTHSSLTGAQAIEHLKASGEYASLQQAFQQAQRGVDAIDATSDFRFDTYLKASNTNNNAWFGSALALSGNTVVIGAPGEASSATGINGNQNDTSAPNAGAVYVFIRDATGWSHQAYIKASNTNAGDYFGTSVAIDGDTLVVGAFGEKSNTKGINGNQSDNSLTNAGAVYVFVRNGTTWTQQAYLKASNTDFDDYFGMPVGIDGDTIVVSAHHEQSNSREINGDQTNNGAPFAGAVYVFLRNGTTWSQQAYLKASNAEGGDYLGYSLAIDGDTVVAGAVSESSNATGVNGNQADNSSFAAGAAYVFVRNGTTWTQQAYLKGTGSYGAQFGAGVAVNDNTVAVGSMSNGDVDIFVRNQNTWAFQTRIGGSGYYRLVSLSLLGDRLLFSRPASPGLNTLGFFGEEKAYLYTRTGTTWNLEQVIQPPVTDFADNFGNSLAMTADTILIGASGEDGSAIGINGNMTDNQALNAGSAFIFSNTPAPTPQCAGLSQEAENGLLTGLFRVAADDAASGGHFVDTANSGNYYAGIFPSYRAEYCFNVLTAGTYRIKSKVYAADDLSDSFYVTVDGAPTNGYLWDVFHNSTYASDYVNNRNSADPVEVQLTSGQHYVTIYLREQGARLDTIELEQVKASLAPTCAGLSQEAESGVTNGNWVIGSDAAASGGAYIHAPNGSGNSWNGANGSQKVSYCFNVATTGTYRIQGKVYGANSLSDSFYVQVDDAPTLGYLWDILPNTTYASDFVNDRSVVDPVELQLAAGPHIVNVFVREDGTRLDTIELQLVNSGPPPTPTCAGLTQEAEDGALFGNFVIGNDGAASNGSYVHTAAGSGDFWNGPNANHKAEYCFNVPTAGTYRIDGKVYGADTLSDSFYVQVDGAPTTGYLWDVLPNTSYQLDSVSDRNKADPVTVMLSSGAHTVTVFAREAGTRLDTIQLNSVAPTAQSRAIPLLAKGIHGTVQLNANNLSTEVDFSTISIKLLDVETNGQSFRQQVTADRFGGFHFDGMLPGNYIVQLQLPDGLLTSTGEITVQATADEPIEVVFDVTASSKTYLPLIGK